MEELIKELEHHYNKLCAEEIFEIFKLATEYFKKMDTVESCVLSNQFQNLKNKTKNETFAKLLAGKSRKENLATLEELTSITKFDQEHYLQYEREVREKDPERTKILFSLHNLLNMFKSGIQSIFIEFDELKNIFDYFHISAYKQIRAFVDIIQSNGMLGVGRDELFLPNYEALVTHGYHYITVEEVANILLDEKLEEFLMDENPANPLGQREVFDCFKETRENYTEQFRACLELDRLFSTKAYTLTEEDYQTIKEKMEFLSFGDVAERVIKQMQNYSKMSNNKVKAKDNNSKGEVSIPKKQTNLNQILREINKYYDVDNRELKEFLSLDEIIYILSLMYSIDIQEEVVESFLRSAMREFKSLHPYAIYNQGYDKFVFLSEENPEVKEHIEMIKYILSEASIFMSSNEKYIETKKLVEEEMKELINLTNGNYRYEIESAKKLCKENQE